MRFAEVAVNAAVQGTFHYHIPAALDATIERGHLVRVAFGTAMQPGIVVNLHDELPPAVASIKTKPIIALLDPKPVMTQAHIDLALWMSATYLTSPGACLWLMLPPGLTGKSTQRVYLNEVSASDPDSTEAEILNALRDHDGQDINQLKSIAGIRTLKRVLKAMEARGLIRIEAALSPSSVKPKTIRTVIRTMPAAEVIDRLHDLSERATKQREVFHYIAKFDYPVPVTDVYDATDSSSAILNTLAKRGLIQFVEQQVFRDSLADKDFVPGIAPRLTQEQAQVWDTIRQQISPAPHPADDAQQAKAGGGALARFLLHGVTGSGKTEIYLHAIAECLSKGRQAIFLVPEIALTPQTIRRVAQRFPDQVAVVHGSLSAGERYDTWRRARLGEIGVIVGTRSALFTPLPDTGLIILDEEHDSSYKQSPPIQPPYYQARDVAEKLALLNDAVLILGSATPDMNSFYRAQQGELTYLGLPERIMGHRERVQKQAKQRKVALAYRPLSDDAMTIDLPPVQVVDMREELKAGNTSMFSRSLQASLQGVVERGEQAILFLNRRGQATYVFCRDCGYVVTCERCDTPMTYHRHGEAMRCHHCGNQQNAPETCPQCRSDRIRYFGAGTQQVEDYFRQQFPHVATVRWDRDTASKPDVHEDILAQFVSGKAQVMVGTQMIAKGLDLPLVTLVGVVSADPGLALPDFRASERSFQLLTQVAGRAGRSVLGGAVVIQTYQPQHPSIVAAAQHNYQMFYEQEAAWRYEAGYPPFRRMGRVLIQDAHPIEAERQAQQIASQLRHHIEKRSLTDTQLIGPAPAFFSRIDRLYRWQILVRSNDPRAAIEGLQIRPGWYVDIDPVDIL